MGMFDGYDSLAGNYAPSNLKPPIKPNKPCNNKLDPKHPNKPFEDYNAEGELIGYWWYYGNTLDLEFTIEQEVVFEGSDTYITAEDFMKSVKPNVVINLYNFRREIIFTLTTPEVEDTVIKFPITEELSKSLVPGTYYCSLTLVKEEIDYTDTIVKLEDCTLTVK